MCIEDSNLTSLDRFVVCLIEFFSMEVVIFVLFLDQGCEFEMPRCDLFCEFCNVDDWD